MSKNKYIFYLLCNKGIIVNLYKLYFSSYPFSLQPNKRVFHPLMFPLLQPNTYEGKPKLFYSPNFPSSHFSSPPTKQILKDLRLTKHLKEREREIQGTSPLSYSPPTTIKTPKPLRVFFFFFFFLIQEIKYDLVLGNLVEQFSFSVYKQREYLIHNVKPYSTMVLNHLYKTHAYTFAHIMF